MQKVENETKTNTADTQRIPSARHKHSSFKWKKQPNRTKFVHVSNTALHPYYILQIIKQTDLSAIEKCHVNALVYILRNVPKNS